MWRKFIFLAGKLFNNATAQLLLILFILVIAALVGGAPNDWGGG
jgi:hypothetical protein